MPFARERALRRSPCSSRVQHPYVVSTFVGISTRGRGTPTLQAISEAPDPELLREIESIVAPVQGKMWITGIRVRITETVCPALI